MEIVFAMNVFARLTVVAQSLEAHLKTRLLQRTTRSLNLTRDGEVVEVKMSGPVATNDAEATAMTFGRRA
jgi:hypothetical protein